MTSDTEQLQREVRRLRFLCKKAAVHIRSLNGMLVDVAPLDPRLSGLLKVSGTFTSDELLRRLESEGGA